MNLTYLNYKEPLRPVEDGFGFFGTIAQTEEGEEVQCHICGGTYSNLGHHAWVRHGIKAREYRIKYQLGLRTPLCSDVWSNKCKEIKMLAWNKLSEEEKDDRRNMMRLAQEKTIRVGVGRSLEALNKDGMCPDQLIEKIQSLNIKLGHSPTHKEFEEEYNGKYVGAIRRTFGSWDGAKHMAGLNLNKSGSVIPHNRSQYSNETLLEFLRSFYKEKGLRPTFSDWRRGFLPSYYLYKHRFGGIEKARLLAGI